MSFDLSSASGSPQQQFSDFENRPSSSSSNIDELALLPESIQGSPPAASDSLPSPTALLHLPEGLESAHVASSATLCVLLHASDASVHHNGHDRKVRFAQEHQPAANAVASAPPKITLDVARCTRQELEACIKDNKSTSYMHKMRELLQQLDGYIGSRDLTVDDLCDVKARLDLIGTQEPYSMRIDLWVPKKLPWPPLCADKKLRGKDVKGDIRALYITVYGHILTGLANRLQEAKGSGNCVLEAEVKALLADEKVFPFDQLLLYAVATNHVLLLESCFSDFQDRMRRSVVNYLNLGNELPIHFMAEHGQEGFLTMYRACCDIMIVYDFHKQDNPKLLIHSIDNFVEHGGEILKCYDEDYLDVFNSYAESSKRNDEVMLHLCDQALNQLDSHILSCNFKIDAQVTFVTTCFQRFATAKNLPPEYVNQLLVRLKATKARCEQDQIALSEQAQKNLQESLLACHIPK